MPAGAGQAPICLRMAVYWQGGLGPLGHETASDDGGSPETGCVLPRVPGTPASSKDPADTSYCRLQPEENGRIRGISTVIVGDPPMVNCSM